MRKIFFVIVVFSFVLAGCVTTPEPIVDTGDSIKVHVPAANAVISSPFSISGEAKGSWFFEGTFPVKLLDAQGNVVSVTVAEAGAGWMTTDFVPFTAKIEFEDLEGVGVLVFERDNPSGLPENDESFSVPVKFAYVASEMMTLKVYFGNLKLDKNKDFECDNVFPVERKVRKTKGVLAAALEELLKGPTEREKADGYSTSINSGVSVRKLIVEEGVAYVDFDRQVEYQVGGSCRTSAIIAEIKNTLMQFSNVKGVVISVEGRTEDALQP